MILPYAYMSGNWRSDFGQILRHCKVILPMSPVNVIREDPENENILYLGADNGSMFSNTGKSWEVFSEGHSCSGT
jgi:hypothetical protein